MVTNEEKEYLCEKQEQVRKSCLERGNPCPNYSHQVGRCLLGYVDPKRIGDGVQAAKQGILNPCPWTEKGRKVIGKL